MVAMMSGCQEPTPSESKPAKNASEEPDSALAAFLQSLPPVQPSDTALEHLTITVNGDRLHLARYLQARAYQNALRSPAHKAVAPIQYQAAFAPFLKLSKSEITLFDLFALFRTKAISMCQTYAFTDGKPNSLDTPNQNTIAYSWGSKQFIKRDHPEKDACSKYFIHGLDCSGFIYQILLQSGVKFTDIDWNVPRFTVTKPFAGYLQPLFSTGTVAVTDLGQEMTFNTGDIVYFMNGSGTPSHIGIVLVSDKNVVSFFETHNGTKCKTAVCCSTNISSGPTIRTLTAGINHDGRKWGVLRITVN